jgi:mono/diheme cytochrome c family protein
MISARMIRPVKLLLTTAALSALLALASGCGSQKIAVASSNPLHAGAVLFNQRCAGCHTLSYAATNGSAANVRSSQYNNGPNFNIRCERPVDRVLYAIENGGFSGAIMPQNIVVGQQAQEVAKFVATYAGRQAPTIPGVVICNKQAVGTITTTVPSSTSSTATGVAPNPAHGGIPGAAPPNLHPKAAQKPAAKKK